MATTTKFKTVNEYISSLPPKTKAIIKELRKAIKETIPGTEEVISYNIPSFKGVIWYAAWKNHISLYPAGDAMSAAIKELSAYEVSNGTIKFTLDEPLPIDLIKKIVKFRIKESKTMKM